MQAAHPHFLLFSSADLSSDRASRWQFVLESIDGTSRLVAGDEEPDAPSERAELLAVVRGLEALDQPSRVTLVTPSRYVSRGIARCLDDWRAAAWRWERFGRVEPIRDFDLWQRVDRAMGYHDVDCHTWPAAESGSDAPPETAESHAPTNSVGQPNAEPAVLIVRNQSTRSARASVLVRCATACDAALTRLCDYASARLRCLVPTPRST